METKDVAPEEMQQRTVRFKELTPRALADAAASGIPVEAAAALAASKNWTYMAPAMEGSFITRHAAITGGDAGNAISVSVANCVPGYGPPLHLHGHTVESFFCLRSRFAIQWGDKGEHEVVLEPYDFVSVPPGVCRRFLNIGDDEGELLVIIQGDKTEFNDVSYQPSLADEIVDRWGRPVLEAMEANGRSFSAGEPE